jgi:hypothetical protein
LSRWAFSTGAFASDLPVRQIDVDSHWGALGTPQAFHLTIRADKGDVDPMRVQALVELKHSRHRGWRTQLAITWG